LSGGTKERDENATVLIMKGASIKQKGYDDDVYFIGNCRFHYDSGRLDMQAH
jgi:hypothetical protein